MALDFHVTFHGLEASDTGQRLIGFAAARLVSFLNQRHWCGGSVDVRLCFVERLSLLYSFEACGCHTQPFPEMMSNPWQTHTDTLDRRLAAAALRLCGSSASWVEGARARALSGDAWSIAAGN